MQVNLFNAKNPNGKRVPVNITVIHADKISTNDGELLYLVTLTTGALSISGSKIDTVYIDDVTLDNFKKEIQKALTTIAAQIDWGILETDTSPPVIMEISPHNNDIDVPIYSDVHLRLKDPFPASFIDLSTISLKANGVDVTGQIQLKEKETEVLITWSPLKITTES